MLVVEAFRPGLKQQYCSVQNNVIYSNKDDTDNVILKNNLVVGADREREIRSRRNTTMSILSAGTQLISTIR